MGGGYILRLKSEGMDFYEICDCIARQIGYDDTVSYADIVTYVEKYWKFQPTV